MKIVFSALMILGMVSASMPARCQSLPPSEVIKGFLSHLETDNWIPDTVIARYIIFKPLSNNKISTGERKKILKEALAHASTELKSKKIDLNELIIERYVDADSSLQKMTIPQDEVMQTYIAMDKKKGYVKYFLVEGKRIKSFTTFKGGKVFIML